MLNRNQPANIEYLTNKNIKIITNATIKLRFILEFTKTKLKLRSMLQIYFSNSISIKRLV